MTAKVVKDKTRELEQALKNIAVNTLLVGIPEDSPGNHRTDSNLTNAQIGYIQEYGSITIPDRPFLIPGVEDSMPDNIKIMTNKLAKILTLKGSKDPTDMLEEMGDNTVKHVREKILEQGLVKTGQLSNSITYTIEK